MSFTRTSLSWMLCLCLALFMLAGDADARLVQITPYDQLTAQADVIVIATPTDVRDTSKETTLPGITRGSSNGSSTAPVPAVSLETTFVVLSVLKGDPALKHLVLHHLREADPPKVEIDAPGLVSFDPKEKRRYLLFLKREADGRYTAVTGQTDPVFSIKDLGLFP
jgi:hypothetical protein